MDKINHDEHPVDDVINHAFRTYPLKPAPNDLSSVAMRRIQSSQSSPNYLPSWIDVALSLFVVGMLAYGWWLWSAFLAPSNWKEWLEFRILLWWEHIRQWFLLRPWLYLYSLVLLMGIVLSMMLLKSIWLALPGLQTKHKGKLKLL